MVFCIMQTREGNFFLALAFSSSFVKAINSARLRPCLDVVNVLFLVTISQFFNDHFAPSPSVTRILCCFFRLECSFHSTIKKRKKQKL